MIENFLTTEQVAKILQVHPFTILKFIKQGKLRGVKLGRVYRIKESDVQAFLDGRMTRPYSQNTTPQPAPGSARLEQMESYESETEPQPQPFPQIQHLPKPHLATPDPYTLRQDENREDGPPHYII